MEDLPGYKKAIVARCESLLGAQIDSVREELRKIQELEQEETKSSAGDKYETTRAMLFLEKEKITAHLSESLKKQQMFRQLNFERRCSSVEPGSLIKTDKEVFLLAVALGAMEIDGQFCYVISPVSPIGKLFLGKQAGDMVEFNTRRYKVLGIC